MEFSPAREYFTYLASERQVGAATQNVAFSAILFLFRHVLGRELDAQGVIRAGESKRLPVVLTKPECRALLGQMAEPQHLLASLLYGAGLRLSEGLRLRVKDLAPCLLTIRQGKGDKDRVTMLPRHLQAPLRAHLEGQKHLWQEQQEQHAVPVYLPPALERKYSQAPYRWEWQFVFPSRRQALDPVDGREKGHHLKDSAVQRAVKVAAGRAGIAKNVSPHVLRHSFATASSLLALSSWTNVVRYNEEHEVCATSCPRGRASVGTSASPRHQPPGRRERVRAHAILLSSQGFSLESLASLFFVDRDTASGWLDRFESQGIAAVHDAPKPGRPSKLPPAARAMQREALAHPTPRLAPLLLERLKKGA